MKKAYARVDAAGLFVEDVILEDIPLGADDLVKVKPPSGFFLPRWTGSEWIEGLTTEEIQTVKDNALDEFPQEPTLVERVDAIEEELTLLFGGGE